MIFVMAGSNRPAIFFMDVANTFIPTAGAVGLLPMTTYFFMVVAMLAFLGVFIFSLTFPRLLLPDLGSPTHRLLPLLTAVAAAVSAIVYYLIQSHYHNVLAELVPVTDATDRQTLIRESYNAIGQYRYMAWFITAPLLLVQLVVMAGVPLGSMKKRLWVLLTAAFVLVFSGYVGHQQLSFDNEIQTGAKLLWGLVSVAAYGFIILTLKQTGNLPDRKPGQYDKIMRLLFVGGWGIYLLGYFLTTLAVDFNWIHIAYTLTDLVTLTGFCLANYASYTNPVNE